MRASIILLALWLFLALVFGSLFVPAHSIPQPRVSGPFFLLIGILPLGVFFAMQYECPGWAVVVYTVVAAAFFAGHTYPFIVSPRSGSPAAVFFSFLGLGLGMVLLCEAAAAWGRQHYGGDT